MSARVELVGGLWWDAVLVPLSSIVELEDGLFKTEEISKFGVGVTLTAGEVL